MDCDERCIVCGTPTGLACPDCRGITPLCANCACPKCNFKPAMAKADSLDVNLNLAPEALDEVERLRPINAALLDALKAMLMQFDCDTYQDQFEIGSPEDRAILAARAAIAQAEGSK